MADHVHQAVAGADAVQDYRLCQVEVLEPGGAERSQHVVVANLGPFFSRGHRFRHARFLSNDE
jgi:hypothetical protein